MALTSNIDLLVRATLTKAAGLSVPVESLNYRKSITLANGTGVNQADLLWHDQRSLAASTSETLDLVGILQNVFGDTFSAARVKALIIVNTSADAEIEVGANSSNGTTTITGAGDVVYVRPGGLFAVAGGDATAYVITADTADLLRVANLDGVNEATYNVFVIAASA